MFDLIINDITKDSLTFLPHSIILSLIVITFYRFLRIYIDVKTDTKVTAGLKRDRRNHLLLLFFFITYIFVTIGITFLSREPGSRNEIRLEILFLFSDNMEARIYAIENVMMFIPFGLLLPLVINKFESFFKCLLAGVLCSLTIELVQYITERGYTELDDVFNNAIGTVIGYVMFVLIIKIIGLRKNTTLDISHDEL